MNNINSDFMNTYRFGHYFNPAYKHYGDDSDVVVGCDRCLINDISISISWTNVDLCLDCISEIDDIVNSENSED